MLLTKSVAGLLLLQMLVNAHAQTQTAPVAMPVIGGERAKKGDSPWLVSLKGSIVKFLVTIEGSYCGGSLIHEQWILTAAHCVTEPPKLRNPSSWTAVLGTNDIPGILDKTKNLIGRMINKRNWTYLNEKIEKIIVHPQYSPYETFRHDLALLKLQKRVSNHPLVRVVGLPDVQDDKEFPPDGNECLFVGWGCTQPSGKISKRGQKIRFRKVADSVCTDLYGVDDLLHFCAGEFDANKGICQGDSGSPLVCFDGNDNPIQVGIASFSSGSRLDRTPGGFVRVSHYIDWIKQVIRRN